MKKINKILTLSLASLMLFACDDIVAQPKPVVDGDHLVTINENSDYYKNNFEVLFDKLTDAGTSSTTLMKQIINDIALNEVSKFYEISIDEFKTVLENVKLTLANNNPATLTGNSKVLEDIILEEVKDTMMDKVRGGSYSTDNLFNEVKLVNELKTSLYKIGGTEFTTDYLITPDSTYEETFKADYSDFIERSIYPDVLQNLLTSVYLFENEYTSLGRAYARDVRYIKLEAISTSKTSVPVLINSYFKSFVNGDTIFPTEKFDLDSLARIYKGVYNLDEMSELDTKETSFTSHFGITTKQDVLDKELEKVGTYNETTGEYDILTDDSLRDDSLVSSYTGTYKYPVSHGKTLKDRELAVLDIVVDDGLAVRSGGVTDLPTEMRNRLFSSGIENNCTTLTNKAGTESLNILTPKSTPNVGETDEDYYLNKYAYYDETSNAYYIVIVDDFYNTTKLRSGRPDLYPDVEGLTFSQEVKDDAMEIARLLSTTTSNQKDALLHYLEAYGLEFGDQDFYDYIESTYPDLLEDDE